MAAPASGTNPPTIHTTAAVLAGPDEQFELCELDLAGPGPTEVVVEVAGVGLCHTDLLARHDGLSVPTVFGHEAAGTISAMGNAVSGLAIGDPVLVSFDYCGVCRPCRRGHRAYCEEFVPRNLTGLGVSGKPSARDQHGRMVATKFFGQSSFSQRVVVSAGSVLPIVDGPPLAITGPLACSLQTGAGAVRTSFGAGPGDRVLVIGAGAVGLAAVMAGVALGAEVVVIDRLAGRAEWATRLGAATVFDELAADIGPVDFVLDTTGLTEAIRTGLAWLSPPGIFGLVGGAEIELRLPSHALTGKSVRYLSQGGARPQQLLPEMLQWWRDGRFPFDQFVTCYPLAEINQAEADLATGAVVKAVLIP